MLIPFSFWKLPTGTTTLELVVSGRSVSMGALVCVQLSAAIAGVAATTVNATAKSPTADRTAFSGRTNGKRTNILTRQPMNIYPVERCRSRRLGDARAFAG